jgi:tripartite ATP-independent transporter DctP family solute receptor
MKRIFALLVTVLVLLTMMGAGWKTKPNVIRVSYILQPDSECDKAAKMFAKTIGEKTQGRVKVQTYPSSQLGGETDLMNLIQVGGVEMIIVGEGVIAGNIPEYGALSMPYAIRDFDHLFKVYKGKIGEEFNQALIKAKGIRMLDAWLRSPRNLTCNKRVRTPDDLKGMKIRLPETKTSVEVWKRFGALPTPMALSEVYTALSQGVVDAQENPVDLIANYKFNEVQKYLVRTEHSISPYHVFINNKFYNSFNVKNKKIIKEAVLEAGKYEYKETIKNIKVYEKQLVDGGMTILKVNKALFRKKLVGLPKILGKELGWLPDLYDRIVKTK